MASFIGECRSFPKIVEDYDNTSGKRIRKENGEYNIRQTVDETIAKKTRTSKKPRSILKDITPVASLNAQLTEIAQATDLETPKKVKRKVTFQEKPPVVVPKALPTIEELTDVLAQLRLPSFNVLLTAEQQGWVTRTIEHLSLNIPYEAAFLMSDFELRYFSEAYPDITRLVIPQSKYISDMGLAFIIDGGIELRSIEIARCEHVTDATLISLGHNCPKLTAFSVVDCKSVTNVGVMALARCCIGLTTLNLDWVSNLSDTSLHVIGRCLPNLTELTLCNCTKFTLKGFEVVLKGCPKLEVLDLWGCEQVNDQWVDAIINAKIPLTVLDIQDCKVTVKGIAKLYAYYPDLILKFDHVTQQQVSQD